MLSLAAIIHIPGCGSGPVISAFTALMTTSPHVRRAQKMDFWTPGSVHPPVSPAFVNIFRFLGGVPHHGGIQYYLDTI